VIGALDVLAHHLAADDVLRDNSLCSRGINTIIQSRRAARTGCGSKPAADRGRRGEDLSHKHVWALGAAPETTLPHQLGVLACAVCFERHPEHFMERR
jgi:hypothetical protein